MTSFVALLVVTKCRRNIIYELVLSTHNDEQKVSEEHFCHDLPVPPGSSIAYPELLYGAYGREQEWWLYKY